MVRDALIAALARPDAPMAPPDAALRPAAVLLAVQDGRLWLTKRASGLRHHPGQIALPGGKLDPVDAGPTDCALREAREEIGLPPAAVEVLGLLPDLATVTGFAITPVLAEITAPFTPIPQPGEVDEVFTVPLAHVLDPSRFVRRQRRWAGQERVYWTVPWGPHYIWGATADILYDLARRMA
ncbi:NUDIX hydrolase [Falsirhodobacter algicola]|uniref:NUDIX domain-containing protein n=1 Tax=Falsirhodobacter algicola TaxID=2692330 RepID=A0A8J8MST6_9RHOB|nr:CoA pyrophosphatase [Falsirhodobacter algicola]QUS36076.1 NUDIX domain-containing protein [Falsirhodobacter algicola]